MPGLAARILMTVPQYDSFILMEKAIGEQLVRRGHDVFIALGSRYPKMETIRQSGIQILSYHIPEDVVYAASREMEPFLAEIAFNRSADLTWIYREKWVPMFNSYCDFMMGDKTFLHTVRSLQFDMAITLVFPLSACDMILPHFLNVPYVTITAGCFPGPWDFGLPALPSFYAVPNLRAGDLSIPDLSTFNGRLINTINFIAKHFMAAPSMWGNTSLLERFASSHITSWVDLLHQSQLFLNEMDQYLESALPVMPNFITISGVTVVPAKPLPEALETIFRESGEQGVIIISFGSSVTHIPDDITRKIIDGLSRVKQTVVAKLVVPDGFNVPTNVKLMSWLPQNDILGHNKTRLFITHCGNKGQYEALYHGVPMLGFSLFAEQAWNCERARIKGFGLKMDITQFTSSEFYENIKQLVENSTYSDTIKKMSKAFRNQPMTGSETAAFWIEHVINNGGDHLRSPMMNMPIYQFLMLDILAAITAAFGTCCVFFVYSIKLLLRIFRKTKKGKTE